MSKLGGIVPFGKIDLVIGVISADGCVSFDLKSPFKYN
jgi:hypothetical protein